MVCSPNDNTLNPIVLPPWPPIPGFGIPFAPLQIPFPDISLPDGIPEDLIALMQQFLSYFPGGPYVPNFDNFSKGILDALASLLNVLAPFLGFYNFIQALLNMVFCIMEVICAINNPFALVRALRKLFKQCVPAFLNLLPWLALLAMIIALILLLLALIAYLIQQILNFLNQLYKNLAILAESVSVADDSSILAASQKIAYILCLIEQLFAILIAFQAILAIIESLSKISGRNLCSSSDTCCSDDVCPPFIRNNPDGLSGTLGHLLYHNAIYNDTSGLGIPLTLPPIRDERWQFVDEEAGKAYDFADIITKIEGNIYWPEGFSFTANANLKKTPYILDLKMRLNPVAFHTSDTGGLREFEIRDCVVTKKPYIGLLNYNNNYIAPDTGTLRIEGGLVYEVDGTPYNVNGQQATLNSFIHKPSGVSTPSPVDDGYNIYDIEYTLKINHAALVEYSLITIGCVPEISIETEVANIVASDITNVFDKIGDLPNINKTLDCLNGALTELRKDVSPANLAIFQAATTMCLDDLNDQALNTYVNAVTAGASLYTTTVDIDPTIQFVNEDINVKVTLRDPGGTLISFNVPSAVQSTLADKLKATVTLGTISDFTFDGYQAFDANITSPVAGFGELKVSFDNQILSEVLHQDDINIPSEIIERVIDYRFVGTAISAVGDVVPVDRRDESDTARDE